MVKYQESEEMYLETILLLKQKIANVHAINGSYNVFYSASVFFRQCPVRTGHFKQLSYNYMALVNTFRFLLSRFGKLQFSAVAYAYIAFIMFCGVRNWLRIFLFAG